jgi:hypothetical protein
MVQTIRLIDVASSQEGSMSDMYQNVNDQMDPDQADSQVPFGLCGARIDVLPMLMVERSQIASMSTAAHSNAGRPVSAGVDYVDDLEKAGIQVHFH